jgi:ATP-dependent DNA helicase RecG
VYRKTGHAWEQHRVSVDEVWSGGPDFREAYEMPDGLLRRRVPAYDKAVVRELMVNALVHRPYTQRGDVFLNLHPDRLEVVNAGRLPLGVTPQNILHASRRRNDGLARVFHDLKLMEREGSGFDLMYDSLLTSGRSVPEVTEGVDSVHVIVPRRVIHPGVIRLISDADQRHHLTQRERIVFGMLGQSEGMSTSELATALDLPGPVALRPWIVRLVELNLVVQTGRTKATRYFVDPSLVLSAGLEGQTTLKRIEPHRTRALIVEDIGRYPGSAASEIHRRVGPEIPERTFRRALKHLLDKGGIRSEGERRWRRYHPSTDNGQANDDGR